MDQFAAENSPNQSLNSQTPITQTSIKSAWQKMVKSLTAELG